MAALLKQTLDNQVQFGAPYPRVLSSVFLSLLNYKWLYSVFRELMLVPFIVRLPAITKQSAQKSKGDPLEPLA